jgi:3D (Asp-Asp-Asp) domain-containing protein
MLAQPSQRHRSHFAPRHAVEQNAEKEMAVVDVDPQVILTMTVVLANDYSMARVRQLHDGNVSAS